MKIFLKGVKIGFINTLIRYIRLVKKNSRGLDQVPFNWFVQKNNISINFLDSRFNRTQLIKKKLNPSENYIIHFRGPKRT